MIINFNEFLTEARKDKKLLVSTIIKLFTERPSVKTTNLTHKDIYPQSAIFQYFTNNSMTIQNATDAMYYMHNDKENKGKMKSVSIKSSIDNKNYPYYYMDLTKEEVDKFKEKIEKSQKVDAKPKKPIATAKKDIKKSTDSRRNPKK